MPERSLAYLVVLVGVILGSGYATCLAFLRWL